MKRLSWGEFPFDVIEAPVFDSEDTSADGGGGGGGGGGGDRETLAVIVELLQSA